MINIEHKGALVYLPAGVRLYQWDADPPTREGQPIPNRYRDTTKPVNVLLVKRNKQTGLYCEVLYAGERWTVRLQDIYPMKTERAEKNEQR